jgi:hypothetical protein
VLDGVDPAQQEARALFAAGHREPELDQQDAVLDEHLLDGRRLPQEALVLLVGAEPHDALHPGPVVPGAVEQHDLPGGREPLDVALEVPLRGLAR